MPGVADLDLLLASTSRYRRTAARRASGIPFRCRSAGLCDEEALKRIAGLAPQALSELLAIGKGDAAWKPAEPHATIIGSDQVAALQDGDTWLILGKPGTAVAATDQLERLNGRTHLLFTAMAVLHRGSVHAHTDITTLTMRRLGREQLARYVEADQPLDCAGAYKLEAHGISLFASIDSRDHSAITGLPLIALAAHLASLGYPIP
jgi:septum formation protein